MKKLQGVAFLGRRKFIWAWIDRWRSAHAKVEAHCFVRYPNTTKLRRAQLNLTPLVEQAATAVWHADLLVIFARKEEIDDAIEAAACAARNRKDVELYLVSEDNILQVDLRRLR